MLLAPRKKILDLLPLQITQFITARRHIPTSTARNKPAKCICRYGLVQSVNTAHPFAGALTVSSSVGFCFDIQSHLCESEVYRVYHVIGYLEIPIKRIACLLRQRGPGVNGVTI